MLIQREPDANNSILSYTDKEVVIQDVTYHQSMIISKDVIISPWPVHHLNELNEPHLESLVAFKPDIILIGHNAPGTPIPMAVAAYLSQKRIGIESMSLGAASRTFNVLLSEERKVVLGIILSAYT